MGDLIDRQTVIRMIFGMQNECKPAFLNELIGVINSVPAADISNKEEAEEC